MTPLQLITEFRAHLDDTDTEDPLWTDTEVLSYLNEAREEFCHETRILVDSEDAMTTFSVLANDIWIAYDDRIIEFERVAYNTTSNRTLHVINYLQLQQQRTHPSFYHSDYGNYPSSARFATNTTWQLETGTPRFLVSDMKTESLRLYPIPTSAFTLQTTVRRLPLADIADAASVDDTALEIPAKYHRFLLKWMNFKAFSKEDGETYDRVNMVRSLGEWNDAMTKVRRRLERQRGGGPRVTVIRDY